MVADQDSGALPVVDLDEALEMMGGDTELLLEVVEVFLEEDYPRQLKALQEGLRDGDAKAVGEAAHGIKGALVSFGGRAGYVLALRLETMGREEGTLEGAEELAERLVVEVERFREYFAHFEQG